MKCREYPYHRVENGSRVGRLLVGQVVGRTKNGSKLWECTCDCGKVVQVVSSSLNSGLKQSCGCLYDEVKGKQTITHGKKNTREYRAWTAMKQRCYYEGHAYYKDYGGRGITVCSEWVDSFITFLDDMGECPKGLSLDRIDVNAGYSKQNCKWSDNSDQGFNTRKKSNNKSGRTGTGYHPCTCKFYASIGVNNKVIHLGVFNTHEEAIVARCRAELKYFGRVKDE